MAKIQMFDALGACTWLPDLSDAETRRLIDVTDGNYKLNKLCNTRVTLS